MSIRYFLFLFLSFSSWSSSNGFSVPCLKLGVIHYFRDGLSHIIFPLNDLLKADRSVRCTSSSNWTEVHGCSHLCPGPVSGEPTEILMQLYYTNSTVKMCSINHEAELEPPTLKYLIAIADYISLTVQPPSGTFDYFLVQCLNEVWNFTGSSSVTVKCKPTANVPLINIVLETVKSNLPSASRSIIQEVPLPISFTHAYSEKILKVFADAPGQMKMASFYQYSLVIHIDNSTYVQDQVYNLIPAYGATFENNLVPNLQYEIIFDHIAPSVGAAQSKLSFRSDPNTNYPLPAANLTAREMFGNIYLKWFSEHLPLDPIEYLVFCDGMSNNSVSVGKNTSYICPQTSFNSVESIKVMTRVNIPRYVHPTVAVAFINVTGVPDVPNFIIENSTETEISIRWNHTELGIVSKSFDYGVQCGSNRIITIIKVEDDEFRCTLMNPGTIYSINFVVLNRNQEIQRQKSSFAVTLLPTVKITHLIFDWNQGINDSIVIEWQVPTGTFDSIEVICPTFITTYEYKNIMPTMYSRCKIENTGPFFVKFVTSKSGYDQAQIIVPINPRNASTITTQATATSSISILSSSSSMANGTSSTTFRQNNATSVSMQSSVATPTVSSSSTSMSVTQSSNNYSTVINSLVSSTGSSTYTNGNCDTLQDDLDYQKDQVYKWRWALIIVAVVAAVLLVLLTFTTVLLMTRCKSK